MRLVILCLLFVGCIPFSRQELRKGMSRNELVWMFGSPDANYQTDTFEKMNYFNRRLTGLPEGSTGDYYIFLRDGKVIEYGIAQIHNRY